jgi:hypothetical protein
MRRLVHYAAGTDARAAVANFHVKNRLAGMGNKTEAKETQLRYSQQPFPKK